MRLHKEEPSPRLEMNATRTSGLRINIAGTGPSEVTAALEHELNQGGVPRRNQETGKFKNINDLAQEIKH